MRTTLFLLALFGCWATWSSVWTLRDASEQVAMYRQRIAAAQDALQRGRIETVPVGRGDTYAVPSGSTINEIIYFSAQPPCEPSQSAAGCMSRLVRVGPGITIHRRYLLKSLIVDIEQIGNRYVVQPKDQHVICALRKPKRVK